jgi:hypothetical protein
MPTKIEAIAKLQRKIDQIEPIRNRRRFSAEFKKWHRDTEVAIQNIFGEGTRHLRDFNNITYQFAVRSSSTPDHEHENRFRNGLDDASKIISSMIEEIEEYGYQTALNAPEINAIACLERICDRFHLVARQIRSRHADRETLDVQDEYDVQDLLHCLLILEFRDIRAEEWTPSYAGGSARVDFLLKQESIIVEVKKTRPNLGAREVGDQLLIDIGRYQAHPDCRTLVCFVYDPEGRIANPRGIETDLTRKVNDMDVRVFIRPKGL